MRCQEDETKLRKIRWVRTGGCAKCGSTKTGENASSDVQGRPVVNTADFGDRLATVITEHLTSSDASTTDDQGQSPPPKPEAKGWKPQACSMNLGSDPEVSRDLTITQY
jgi:hypothetical protein